MENMENTRIGKCEANKEAIQSHYDVAFYRTEKKVQQVPSSSLLFVNIKVYF